MGPVLWDRWSIMVYDVNFLYSKNTIADLRTDGMHNDARMNVTLAVSAAAYGATVANYVRVEGLTTGPDGKVNGATVKNCIQSLDGKTETFDIRAKGVINATGPFTDSIRKMAIEGADEIVAPSSGTHIILPQKFGPSGLGLLDPKTSDGRVLFFLPWLGHILAGTTDEACNITKDPTPKDGEIEWILRELNRYMQPGVEISRSDVLSAWTGIRPLVRDPSKAKSEGLVRNHLITKSSNGLITMAGGKWTTYRQMAEEAVDEAIHDFGLSPHGLDKPVTKATLPCIGDVTNIEHTLTPDGTCQTLGLRLVGAHGWTPALHADLTRRFDIQPDVAKHLATAYGDRAWQVAALCQSHGARLSPHHPFVAAEIVHAVRAEYAQTVVDVMARRMRLAFLDARAAEQAVPAMCGVMGDELGWSRDRREKERKNALDYLKTMVSLVMLFVFFACTATDGVVFFSGTGSAQVKSVDLLQDFTTAAENGIRTRVVGEGDEHLGNSFANA